MDKAAEVFNVDTIETIGAGWRQLSGEGESADQVDFSVVARGDILEALGWGAQGDVSQSDKAVICGFFYRQFGEGQEFETSDKLSAGLLGEPQLDGAKAGGANVSAYSFWFGPLEVGKKYTLKYDVDGVKPFSREITPKPGLNIVHIPVWLTKPLVYIMCHSHFDPEWRDDYEGYLEDELPKVIERIKLLRSQPEHCFIMDEDCVSRELIERYPQYHEELRRRVMEGVVDVKGIISAGELTMPLGEIMIRQMTEGEQLISSLLGVIIRPTHFWNIDNYGVNLQMPQILSKAGRKYMVVGELGCSPERLPWSNPQAWDLYEFYLEGLDGSKILVHRSHYSNNPYAPLVQGGELAGHQSIFNFEGSDFTLPNYELPEIVRNLNDPESQIRLTLDKTNTPQRPIPDDTGRYKYIIATTDQFFRAVETSGDVPTIKTESRIDFWTGSYESRVRGRQLNRQVECLLLAAESVSTAAKLAGMEDVLDDLKDPWYQLLINNHHDPQLTIMGPGLFDEVIERYEQAREATETILEDSLSFLTQRITTDEQEGEAIIVFNSLGWPRSGVVDIDLPGEGWSGLSVVDAEGKAVSAQVVSDENGDVIGGAFLADAVPGAGWQTYYVREAPSAQSGSDLVADENLLENDHLRIEFDEGQIGKIIEKSTGRCLFETRDDMGINELFIWKDYGCISQVRPIDFMDSAQLLCRSSQVPRKSRLIEAGSARAVIETSFEMDWGVFKQKVILGADSRWIDLQTDVNWQPDPVESNEGRRVRVAFPSTFENAKVWRDIPFAVQPWEQSDVITPINSWLGIADDDDSAGAALVHDGPCSQQVRDDCIWQTLFRSIRMPGEVADSKTDHPCGWDKSGDTALEEGKNTYKLRLYPFGGDWKNAAVPRVAIEFNTSLYVKSAERKAGQLPGRRSHLAFEPGGIVHCTWKCADYSDATIVRVYNPTGDTISGSLSVGFDIKSAQETNFREEHSGDLTVRDGEISLRFTPYEIKTILLAVTKK